MSMNIKSSLLQLYDAHYKPLMLITVGAVILALAILLGNYMITGEFINKGVSLKGGLTVTVPTSTGNHAVLQELLQKKFPDADLGVRGIGKGGQRTGIIIETTIIPEDELIQALASAGINEGIPLAKGQYSIENMGSALGTDFFKQTTRALVLAFVFMAIVVFITFRSPAPSFFVVLAAFSDIICTLAVITVLGVKLSTPGIAALLMLIGYSVDTDILLTSRVLRSKEGTILERILGAMRTGSIMTATALAAIIPGYFFTESDVIKQIMLILIIGLVIDYFMTWIQNAGILRWYLDHNNQPHNPPHKEIHREIRKETHKGAIAHVKT